MDSLYKTETIVARATPAGNGGLAVVRLSGPKAPEILFMLLGDKEKTKPESHRAKLCNIYDPNNSEIDEVLVLPMWAPNSYTAEDTVELFCHGGSTVTTLVIEACVGYGARQATEGEFTRRAFLNGKLSLDQAEAVVDLIHAENKIAAKAALNQLHGGMKNEIVNIEKPLIKLLAELEGGLEFQDFEVPEMPREELSAILQKSIDQISTILNLAEVGKKVRDGVHVVFAGPPNSGKSSLFNALLDYDRAIVDSQAGTTRDVVSESLKINGLNFIFHDTAGVRATAESIEQKGIQRTRKTVEDADIILLVQSPDTQELSLGDDINGQLIVVGNKNDIEIYKNSDINTSTKENIGIAELKNAIFEAAKTEKIDSMLEMGVFLNDRHREKLNECRAGLSDLVDMTKHQKTNDDVIATLLATSLSQLGEVSGRVYSESLLEEIFSTFCVGK